MAALEVIAPEDAGHLWEALQSSRKVEKALGIPEHQPAERKYLEALAETYQHATSWDTRRQVLAISADLKRLSVRFKSLFLVSPNIDLRKCGCIS